MGTPGTEVASITPPPNNAATLVMSGLLQCWAGGGIF